MAKVRVLVYQAEAGDVRTQPSQRKPVEIFEIEDSQNIDSNRQAAFEEVSRRYGIRPGSPSMLANGSISITLPARA